MARDSLAGGNCVSNLEGSDYYLGSVNGDRRAVKLQCHTGSYLDPRDEGIAIFLSLKVEFSNLIGTGGH